MGMLLVDELENEFEKEETLIILISRLYFKTQDKFLTQRYIDSAVINWERFYKLLTINQIRGFIYGVISSEQLIINPIITSRLRTDAMQLTRQGFYQYKITRHLLSELEKLDIAIIAYKGAVLAKRYYNNPFLRESSDIDLFADKADVKAIRHYLYDNGYVAKFDAADKYLPYLLNNFKELSFSSPFNDQGLSCSVEVQWALLENYFEQLPAFNYFHRHRTDHAQKQEAITCLDETHDFICIASHHLIKEPLWKFKYLIDLGSVIDKSAADLEWNVIDDFFKAYKYSKFLNSGMTALQDILGLTVNKRIFPKVRYDLFLAGKYAESYKKDYFQLLAVINSKQNRKQKLRFNLKAFFSVFKPNLEDLSMFKLPAWATPVLIAVKPLRLLLSGGKKPHANK